MATERCQGCGRGLRDGTCTDPDCGFVPGPNLHLVRDPVDRPRHTPQRSTTTTAAAPPRDPDDDVWRPFTEEERAAQLAHARQVRATLEKTAGPPDIKGPDPHPLLAAAIDVDTRERT